VELSSLDLSTLNFFFCDTISNPAAPEITSDHSSTANGDTEEAAAAGAYFNLG
jgi:hypothetical protein